MPAPPKQLIMSSINGLDDKGHFQTGFAIDFAPAQLFKQSKLMDRYRDAWRLDLARQEGKSGDKKTVGEDLGLYFRTVLNRTQLSFASIRGTEGEDKSAKLALGINITLLDANDVLSSGPLDKETLNGAGELAIEGAYDALNREFLIKTPFEDSGFGWWANLLYRHASWSVGGALTWVSENGKDDDYDYAGGTAWSTFAFSLSKPDPLKPQYKSPYQALVHFRYDDQQEVPGSDAVSPPSPEQTP